MSRRERLALIVSRPQFRFAAIVLIPSVIWYTVFVLVPVLQTIQISTLNYQLLDPSSSRFVGLDNFTQLIANPLFPIAVVNTIVWTVMALVVIIPISLLLAQCLVIVGRGRNVYQAFIFLPVVVSLVAVALIFRILMDPEVGYLNKLFSTVGLPRLQWLSASDTALPVLLGIASWKAIGVFVVILTAGMLNIPDGAVRRGAGGWCRRLAAVPTHHAADAHQHPGAGNGAADHRQPPGVHLAHGRDPGWARQRDVLVQHAHLPGSVRERPLRDSSGRRVAPVRGHPRREHHVAPPAPTQVVLLTR